jgi:hypothetical protein
MFFKVVIPAKAGIQCFKSICNSWIPASAGMTNASYSLSNRRQMRRGMLIGFLVVRCLPVSTLIILSILLFRFVQFDLRIRRHTGLHSFAEATARKPVNPVALIRSP